MILICKKLLPFLFLVLTLTLCSRAAPTLSYVYMQVVYFEEEPDTYIPRMSFFVIANDDDGIEDIAELRLYNDFEGLVWKCTPEDWTMLIENSKTWIGSRNLVMPTGESFPSGQYRAVIADKGGDQSEKRFGFDVIAQSRYPFPKFNIAEGVYTVESLYPANSFICYNSLGEYRNTLTIPSKTGNIPDLHLSNDIAFIALWCEDKENSVSAVTRQISIK
ncbi:MAG: hypothetical protein LBV52_03505 [Spirochaetaceae bacterium]|jgi:hypothetical protein|nr:hypothetical protein [Spirochaetaceae bacterium]